MTQGGGVPPYPCAVMFNPVGIGGVTGDTGWWRSALPCAVMFNPVGIGGVTGDTGWWRSALPCAEIVQSRWDLEG